MLSGPFDVSVAASESGEEVLFAADGLAVLSAMLWPGGALTCGFARRASEIADKEKREKNEKGKIRRRTPPGPTPPQFHDWAQRSGS